MKKDTRHTSAGWKVRTLTLTLGMALAGAALAGTVSWEDIANDDKTPKNVLMYGMGLKGQRFSALKQVSTKNVADLVPAWSFSFGGEKQRGQETQAIVHDGVIYITASYSRMFAIDAKTGSSCGLTSTGWPTTSAHVAT